MRLRALISTRVGKRKNNGVTFDQIAFYSARKEFALYPQKRSPAPIVEIDGAAGRRTVTFAVKIGAP
jgi:hypothetical protein